MLTFKAKMAGLLMKDNNGTNKNPNEPQQNYHIMKLKPPYNEIHKASPNEFK